MKIIDIYETRTIETRRRRRKPFLDFSWVVWHHKSVIKKKVTTNFGAKFERREKGNKG